MRIRVATRWDDIPVSLVEWDAFIGACGNATVFQTYEWFASWWIAYGHAFDLLFFTAHEGERLIGMAPLMFARSGRSRGCVSFVGGNNADYQDFLVLPGARARVLDGFLSELYNLGIAWHVIQLRNIPNDSETALCSRRSLQPFRGLYATVSTTPCYSLVIRGQEGAVRRIQKRASVRRAVNYFGHRGHLRWSVFRDVDEALKNFPEFAAQHEERWRRTSTPSQFRDPNYRFFFERLIVSMASRGWLHFSAVEIDGRPIAYNFGFFYRGRLFWYKPCFDVRQEKGSPGTLLIHFLIDHALAVGAAELDFTIGDEPFKTRFTNSVRTNQTIVLYRRYGGWLAASANRCARATAKRILKPVLARARGDAARTRGRFDEGPR